MIIIEGCDSSGKSTLVRFIKENYQVQTVHSPGPWDSLDSLMKWCKEASNLDARFRGRLVCDRHPFFSESVYGPALRGSSMLDAESYYSIKYDLAHHFPAVIICCPPEEVMMETYGQKAQLPKIEQLSEISKAYQAYADTLDFWPGFFTDYNYTSERSKAAILPFIELYFARIAKVWR